MLISYYQDGVRVPKPISLPIGLLMSSNALFSGAILFAWTYMAIYVAEPLAWATWMPISRGIGTLGMLEFPFIVLWGLPLAGIFGSWLSLKGGSQFAAYTFVLVPLVMLALIIGWFYWAPPDWR